MQGQGRVADAASLQGRQQLGREVQPGGGGSYGALPSGVDRLIVVEILGHPRRLRA